MMKLAAVIAAVLPLAATAARSYLFNDNLTAFFQDVRMTTDDKATRQTMMQSAFHHLQAAIELLDQAEAPGQIAAHIDLAVHQLADPLGVDLEAGLDSPTHLELQKLATS